MHRLPHRVATRAATLALAASITLAAGSAAAYTDYGLSTCLRAPDGRFVSADPFGTPTATAGACADETRFDLVDLDGAALRSGDTVALRSAYGVYLSAAADGRLSALSRVVRGGETFVVEKLAGDGAFIGAGDTIALRDAYGSYVDLAAGVGGAAEARPLALDGVGALRQVPREVAWAVCAPENGTCRPNTADGIPVRIRYGVPGHWSHRVAHSGADIPCDNGYFGDPIFGTVKRCEIGGELFDRAPTAAASWVHCADEWGTCQTGTDGTSIVRYGVPGHWVHHEVGGARACTNDAFGHDPIFGTFKRCEVLRPAAAAEPGPADLTPDAQGFVTLVIDNGPVPMIFEVRAEDVAQTAGGWRVAGDVWLYVGLGGGHAVSIAEAVLDFGRGADGRIDHLTGVARMPLPTFGLLDGLHLPQDAGVVEMGMAYGRDLDHLAAPLNPDTRYLYFAHERGFTVESGGLSFTAPGSGGGLFVFDPSDPFFYVRGSLPARGPMPALDDVGLGVSVHGSIPFAPAITWGVDAGDLAPFSGHLLVSGDIPLRNISAVIRGEMVAEVNPDGEDGLRLGTNADLDLSFELYGFGFTHNIGQSTAQGSFTGTGSRMAWSGVLRADSPSFFPAGYPVQFDGSNVRVAGQISDDLDRMYARAEGQAFVYGVPVAAASFDVDRHHATLAGRVGLGGTGVDVSGTLDAGGAELTGSVSVNLPFTVPLPLLGNLSCGTELITDAAICGVETVTDAALCGITYVPRSVCSTVCDWLPFGGSLCDTVCDTVFDPIPNTCDIALSCDVDVSCLDWGGADLGRLEADLSVTLGSGGLGGSANGRACIPDFVPGIGGCHTIAGARLDLDGSPEICFDLPFAGGLCAGL